MVAINENTIGDLEFLPNAIHFCENIDPYIEMLGLDYEAVIAFKSDFTVMSFISKNYDHLQHISEGAMQKNLTTIRTAFQYLCKQCKESPNYTPGIGQAIGVEGVSNLGDPCNIAPQPSAR